MKHPLTSKERRGLTAVAAAALLCIGAGFAFRSCRSYAPSPGGATVVVDDSTAADSISEMSEKVRKERRGARDAKRKQKNSGKTKKSEKTFPTRSPLDEPCD